MTIYGTEFTTSLYSKESIRMVDGKAQTFKEVNISGPAVGIGGYIGYTVGYVAGFNRCKTVVKELYEVEVKEKAALKEALTFGLLKENYAA